MTGLDTLRQRPTVSIAEAAELLKVSRYTAYRWARSGHLPTLRIGGTVRVKTAPLLDMLEAR